MKNGQKYVYVILHQRTWNFTSYCVFMLEEFKVTIFMLVMRLLQYKIGIIATYSIFSENLYDRDAIIGLQLKEVPTIHLSTVALYQRSFYTILCAVENNGAPNTSGFFHFQLYSMFLTSDIKLRVLFLWNCCF